MKNQKNEEQTPEMETQEPEMESQGPENEEQTPETAPKAESPAPGVRKVRITLPRPRGSEAKELFVAVNGVEYLIPKGKPVEVPAYIAEEIQRAEAAEARMYEEKDRLLASSQFAG